MSADDKHAGNVLLLRVGMITLLIALVLAWCLMFTVAFKIQFALDIFKHTDDLLSAHLDFLMMTMLLFGFYCVKAPLPLVARWGMSIGSITNPTCFLIESVHAKAPPEWFGLFALISVTITTVGYAIGAITLLRWSMRSD